VRRDWKKETVLTACYGKKPTETLTSRRGGKRKRKKRGFNKKAEKKRLEKRV